MLWLRSFLLPVCNCTHTKHKHVPQSKCVSRVRGLGTKETPPDSLWKSQDNHFLTSGLRDRPRYLLVLTAAVLLSDPLYTRDVLHWCLFSVISGEFVTEKKSNPSLRQAGLAPQGERGRTLDLTIDTQSRALGIWLGPTRVLLTLANILPCLPGSFEEQTQVRCNSAVGPQYILCGNIQHLANAYDILSIVFVYTVLVQVSSTYQT